MKTFFRGLISDRHSTTTYPVEEEYTPGRLRRLHAWIVGERVHKIEEELPSFNGEFNNHMLIGRRTGTFVPTQCSSEPDMLTEEMIYARRALYALGIVGFLRFVQRKRKFFVKRKIVYYSLLKHPYLRPLVMFWMFYLGSIYGINRDSQRRIY